MRAFYRVRVKPGQEEAFIKAWVQATTTVRANVKGARGSMLLRSHADPSLFTATARWDSFEEWQSFMASDPSTPQGHTQSVILSADHDRSGSSGFREGIWGGAGRRPRCLQPSYL